MCAARASSLTAPIARAPSVSAARRFREAASNALGRTGDERNLYQ